MKKGKIKTIIMFLIISIFIFFCALVGYYVVRDFKEEDLLREDIKEINNMILNDNANYNEIEKRLKTYVTTGENLTFEKVVKAYYIDAFNIVLEHKNIINDERIINLLNINSIKNDAPDFSYTINYISDTNKRIETLTKTVKNFLSEEKTMSYYNNANLDSYYYDLYIELTSVFNYFTDGNKYENDMNILVAQLNNINEIFDFLAVNKNSWTIINDLFYFKSDELLIEFKTLISKVGYSDNGFREYNF